MTTRAHTRRETPRRHRDHGDRDPRAPAPAPAPAERPQIRRLVVFESLLAASRPTRPPGRPAAGLGTTNTVSS